MKAVRTNGGMELKRGVNNRTGISADLFGVYVYEKITHTFAHCLQKMVYHFVQKEESTRFTENFLALRYVVAYTNFHKVSPGFI